mgnify:CR=1 FL=1
MKIRFQRIVAFIGIVIAFLNCGIIYNIYAKENTSDDKNIVIANTYMKELTNITSEEHDEVTVKSYEIDKAFYVYLFDDVNLFSVSSKINVQNNYMYLTNHKIKKQDILFLILLAKG